MSLRDQLDPNVNLGKDKGGGTHWQSQAEPDLRRCYGILELAELGDEIRKSLGGNGFGFWTPRFCMKHDFVFQNSRVWDGPAITIYRETQALLMWAGAHIL